MSAIDLLSRMAANGQYHFTTSEIRNTLGSSKEATRAVLRRLKNKGLIATPLRSFHVIIPPEYQHLGCLPADQFISHLMANLEQPYYVALLSAARYHGAAHQQPQLFHVLHYLSQNELRVSRAEFEAYLEEKRKDRYFTQDITPLLAAHINWDAEDAFDYVQEKLISLLPGNPWKGSSGP